MEKLFKYKPTLFSVISGGFFLGALIIGVPLVLGKIFWATSKSIFVTQYIYFSFLAFFLIFLGILVPLFRWIFNHFKITKANPFDIIATVLLFFASSVPLLIIFTLSILVFKLSKKQPYKYFYVLALAVFILLGVKIRRHGRLIKSKSIIPINHSSELDYILSAIVTRSKPWNAVAGINLSINKETLRDKVIVWLIGDLIKNYAITVDRNDSNSRANSIKRTKEELAKFIK